MDIFGPKTQNEYSFFYETFLKFLDTSRLVSAFAKIYQRKFSSFRKIGSGRHSECWLIYQSPEISYTLSIPHEIHHNHNLKKTLNSRSTFMNLNSIRQKNIIMIPPYELIQWNDKVALSIPYGDDKPQKKIIDIHKASSEMNHQLNSYGFYLDDYLQIRYWQNLPFVIDLSDLKKL